VFSTLQVFPPSTVRYIPPLTLAMYPILGVSIDTAWGTRDAVVLPDAKTLMVVQVTPPSSVLAAKLLAPSTIATSLLA
jgi:hypothetical protein